MRVNVHDKIRMVEVWLTNGEKCDLQIQAQLKDLYDEYKKKKYLVVVFQSGEQDLYQNTRDLLLYNRRCTAERTALGEKPQSVGLEQ